MTLAGERTQIAGTLQYYEDISLEDLQQIIRLRPFKLETGSTFFRAPRPRIPSRRRTAVLFSVRMRER